MPKKSTFIFVRKPSLFVLDKHYGKLVFSTLNNMKSFAFYIISCFFVLNSCKDGSESSQSINPDHSPASFMEVDQKRFEEILDSSDGLVLLKVYSENCHYCRKYVPILERLAEKNPSVTFLKTQVPQNSAWAQTEKQRGTPSVKIYKNGKLVAFNIGLFNEDELNTELDKFR